MVLTLNCRVTRPAELRIPGQKIIEALIFFFYLRFAMPVSLRSVEFVFMRCDGPRDVSLRIVPTR